MPWERPPRVGEYLFDPTDGTGVVRGVYPAFTEDGEPTGLVYEIEMPRGYVKSMLPELMRKTRPLMSRNTALQVLGIISDRLSGARQETPAQRLRQYALAAKSGDPIESARALQTLLMRADGYGSAPLRISRVEQRHRETLTRRLCQELQYVLGGDLRAFVAGVEQLDEEGHVVVVAERMDCKDYLASFSRRLARKVQERPNPAAIVENVAMYEGRTLESLNRSWKALLRRIVSTPKRPVTAKTRRLIAEKQLAILRTLDESL